MLSHSLILPLLTFRTLAPLHFLNGGGERLLDTKISNKSHSLFGFANLSFVGTIII